MYFIMHYDLHEQYGHMSALNMPSRRVLSMPKRRESPASNATGQSRQGAPLALASARTAIYAGSCAVVATFHIRGVIRGWNLGGIDESSAKRSVFCDPGLDVAFDLAARV